MEKVRVGIVGSRLYENKLKIKEFVFKLKQKFDGENKRVIVVSGGCKDGADRYAKKYALEFGLDYEEYPPAHQQHSLYCVLPRNHYNKIYHPSNFHMRNKLIAKSSDYIVGFIPIGVDAKGTKSTLEYARDYNKKYKIIN